MPRALPAPYSKTQALADLRSLAEKKPTMCFHDLPPALRRAVHRHWGTMAKARRAARIPSLSPGRTPLWTEQRVLATIRSLARQRHHMSQGALIAAGHGRVVTASIHVFGSFSRARELAGVQMTKRRGRATSAWDADTVVATIRTRHEAQETLAVTKAPKPLVNAANRIFGSWRSAIEAAGLDYDRILLRRDYSDAELLDWMRQLSLTHPSMTLNDLDAFGEHTVACRRRWGSLERAASAAGLEGWPKRVRHEAMSQEAIVSALRRMARAGAALNLTRVRRTPGNQRLVDGVFKHFLTWDDAIAAAGLPSQRKVPPPRRAT